MTLLVIHFYGLRVINTSDAQIASVETPQEYLKEISGKDYKVLYRIAQCESHFNPLAKNKTSSASGIFQFLSSTWEHWGTGDVFDPYENISAAVRLYQAKSGQPWLASRDCWRE